MTTAIRTTAPRRRRGLVLLSVVVGLVLSACSPGPSQVNAAAIVGGQTISVDRVQDLVDKAIEIEPAAQVLADQRKLDLLSRGILRQLVMHELTEAYARENSITVDPAQVSEFASRLAESLQPLPTDGSVPADAIVDQAVNRVFDIEMVARDYLLQREIGARAVGSLAITADVLFLSPDGFAEETGSLRGRAEDLARRIAVGPEAATRVVQAEIDAGTQGLQAQVLTPADVGNAANSLLFGTPAGNVVAFELGGETVRWVVAVLRERTTDAEPNPAANQDPRLATVLGPRLLQPMVDKLGVRISPRYGVWDKAAMGIAPSEQETTGFIVPIGAAQP